MDISNTAALSSPSEAKTKIFAPTAIILLLSIFIQTTCYGLAIPVIAQMLAIEKQNIMHIDVAHHVVYDVIYSSGLMAALSPAYLICAPLIGAFSDFLGRKKILLLNLVFSLIAYSLLLLAGILHNTLFILLALLLLNMSITNYNIVQAAIADISQNKQRAIYFGILNFILINILLSGALGAYGLTLSSEKIKPFFFIILLALALTIFITFFIQKLFTETLNHKKTAPLPLQNSLYQNNHYSRWLWYFLAMMAINQYAWGLYDQIIKSVMKIHFDFSAQAAEWFLVEKGIIMGIVLCFFYPLLVRYVSLKKLLVISTTGGFIGLAITSSTHSLFLHYASLIIIAVSESFILPIIITLISQYTKSSLMGLTMGLQGTLFALVWSGSILSASLLDEIYINLPLDLATGLLLILVLAVFYFAFKTNLKNKIS